jgi:hypothetical protein
MALQYDFAERVILRHRVSVIDAVARELRFEHLTLRGDSPDVLRPPTALLAADPTATGAITKQL